VVDLAEAVRKEVTSDNARLLTAERERIHEDERKRAKSETESEQVDLQARLNEKDEQLASYRETELELRKRERALKREIDDNDVLMARKEDELREQITAETEERYGARLQEKDDQLERVRKEADDLRRKAETGSKQQEGIARQRLLADELVNLFPTDEITMVNRGQAGADVKQVVRDERGHQIGMILWESKRAARWNAEWPRKLARDVEKAGANIGVLVSTTLPPEAKPVSERGDVWLTDFQNTPVLAIALRVNVIAVDRQLRANSSRDDAAGRICDYIFAGAFAKRVLGLFAFIKSQVDGLDREQAWMTRSWAARRKQHEGAMTALASLIGDLEGLGAELPDGLRLELPPPGELGPGEDLG
jgi:hypothetical protein